MHFTFGVTLLIVVGAVYCAPPKAPCSAPLPPEHGQAFLDLEGRVVKYACDPGYALKGKEIIECVEGKWEEPNPACIEIEGDSKSDQKTVNVTDENGEDIQLPSLPAAAMPEDEEGYQSDSADSLRQLYWYSHYYHGSSPRVMTLTDSQIAWIDSLHPELRDQYLRNAYIVRVGDSSEPKRVESIVARDPYDYVYHVPYVRRPVSYIVDDPIATYDFSCSSRYHSFIKAPRLPNMQVARYDRRQNPNSPHNYYLTAVYRCKDGYEMRDTRFTELNCRKQDWVGVRPICDRRN